MYFIQNYKGILIEKLSTVNKPLQEDTISHEQNLCIILHKWLHRDMVANCSFFRDLFGEDTMQIFDC